MCAICGILNFDPAEAVDANAIAGMAETLHHRGPDDDGFLIDGQAGLGFRRLSIIDRSGGHQPIQNEDRSAVIVFNGEIYNYRELAASLTASGHVFSTRSDTETILHAYEEHGEDCVDLLRGMFAFAIWDRNRRKLVIARDRVGIKPLYYYQNGRFLAFASEIKALFRIAGVPCDVDPEALDQYLSLRYVPGPRTMFRNIFRLQPGHMLVADPSGVRIRRYWNFEFNQRSIAPAEALEKFEHLIEESVRMHLVSEVPLGVALSGGLDSSAILALMSKIRGAGGGSTRIKTFSVGYEDSSAEERESSEFEYARMAAGAFGAEHYEYRLTAKAFEEFIPRLVWHLDEPLADPSCIPLHYISKLAREHITVILSGEGADEILAGYNIYGRMLAMDSMNRRIPQMSRIAPMLAKFAPSEKLRRYVRMSGQSIEERYRGVCKGFGTESLNRLIGAGRTKAAEQSIDEIYRAHFRSVAGASPLNRMLYADAKVWLPDDLLLKADKMTMANSLELRVPFLDHRLVEFAGTLPDNLKIGKDGTKTLLRQAMRGVLPAPIIDRPKKGFPVPLSSWLRTPLRQFTRDHLMAPQSACRAWLDSGTVERMLTEHERGKVDRSQELWALLVFEFWHSHFVKDNLRKTCAA
ncbi:MAG: asparagine synthase (glutamine-hydrolyzing) [Acidobacteriota bacterium]|nr:asparagine synthase (glutamine-hydrolyzing) [Acidobacteriota bacterium]